MVLLQLVRLRIVISIAIWDCKEKNRRAFRLPLPTSTTPCCRRGNDAQITLSAAVWGSSASVRSELRAHSFRALWNVARFCSQSEQRHPSAAERGMPVFRFRLDWREA